MQYELSNEVERIADEIIGEHLPDLDGRKISYFFIVNLDEKTGQLVPKLSKGKQVLAELDTDTGKKAFRIYKNNETTGAALWVYKHAWNLLTPDQRKALIHQQLCRLDFDLDSGKPSIIEYDVKEFSQIARLYGGWNADLDIFLKAAKPEPLFEWLNDAEAKGKVKVVKPTAGNGKVTEEAPKSDLSSLKQEVAKKRGRGASAGAK